MQRTAFLFELQELQEELKIAKETISSVRQDEIIDGVIDRLGELGGLLDPKNEEPIKDTRHWRNNFKKIMERLKREIAEVIKAQDNGFTKSEKNWALQGACLAMHNVESLLKTPRIRLLLKEPVRPGQLVAELVMQLQRGTNKFIESAYGSQLRVDHIFQYWKARYNKKYPTYSDVADLREDAECLKAQLERDAHSLEVNLCCFSGLSNQVDAIYALIEDHELAQEAQDKRDAKLAELVARKLKLGEGAEFEAEEEAEFD